MNERIKKIRKTLDLTQREFAERIGMKRNSIALIESGRKTSNQTISLICREFNVNEEWLKTGEGEMFKPTPKTAMDILAEEYNLSPDVYVLVEKFINLKPDAQETILNYIKEVAAAFQSDESDEEKRPIAIDELTDEEKVELYRRELEREKKARERSEVS